MGPIDPATRSGDGVLARHPSRRALVRDLRVLLVDVIQVLKDDPVAPGAVVMPAAADARIPLPER